MGKKKI